jgi:hypothetical protein
VAFEQIRRTQRRQRRAKKEAEDEPERAKHLGGYGTQDRRGAGPELSWTSSQPLLIHQRRGERV